MPMIRENLTPCANLLYQWIVRKVPNKDNMLKLDIRDFQAWSAEFRDFPYSEREILNALRQLKQLELIGVTKTEVTIRSRHRDYPNVNGKPQTSNSALRSFYLVPGMAFILAIALLGTLKVTSISNASLSLQTQFQNLKLPNLWGHSNQQ